MKSCDGEKNILTQQPIKNVGTEILRLV